MTKFSDDNKKLLEMFEKAGTNNRIAAIVGIQNFVQLPDGFSGEISVTVDQGLNCDDLIELLRAALEMAETHRTTVNALLEAHSRLKSGSSDVN